MSANGGDDAAQTTQKIPTLEEVIALCNGKILLNLDKLKDTEFEEVYEIFERNGAADIAMFKSSNQGALTVAKWFCELIREGRALPYFSPMVYSTSYVSKDAINRITQFTGIACMMECDRETDSKIADGAIAHMSACGIRPMCLTANTNNPPIDIPTYWEFFSGKGFNSIMTDDPKGLEDFIMNN